MDLVLWRHAEAFDAREGQDDLDRPLSPKGERQAQRVAAWLNRQLPAGTRVLASPARRCQQTAAVLERRVKTLAELAPGGSVEALLHAARWPESREPVLVIGHQPTLGLAAALLLAGEIQPWAVRKAGAWWLRSRERGDEVQFVLHAVIGPETL
ncbi:SixA phosphatase family protein [Rubrivivax gelatinosus]|uniref:Histidine phosphatase family protein n=1 Tax=Rubrivivax gelatinosus TaxID=28068 RepID=A0ABS1DUN3_RUBGE|nr:histidine phosphatase family protein [Rubrivivax gelatinosus]MBK1712472.1 histidine phosphatase family protein [Rubrivivax gelatinosus]